MSRRFPKVKVDKKGMAVLSGIHIRDLCSIFTAASLHHYDTEKNYRSGGERYEEALRDRAEDKYGLGEISWRNHLDNCTWVRRIRLLIDSLDHPPYNHGYNDIPVSQLDKSGRFCRLRAVREQRDQRLLIKKIVEEALASKGVTNV